MITHHNNTVTSDNDSNDDNANDSDNAALPKLGRFKVCAASGPATPPKSESLKPRIPYVITVIAIMIIIIVIVILIITIFIL